MWRLNESSDDVGKTLRVEVERDEKLYMNDLAEHLTEKIQVQPVTSVDTTRYSAHKTEDFEWHDEHRVVPKQALV